MTTQCVTTVTNISECRKTKTGERSLPGWASEYNVPITVAWLFTSVSRSLRRDFFRVFCFSIWFVANTFDSYHDVFVTGKMKWWGGRKGDLKSVVLWHCQIFEQMDLLSENDKLIARGSSFTFWVGSVLIKTTLSTRWLNMRCKRLSSLASLTSIVWYRSSDDHIYIYTNEGVWFDSHWLTSRNHLEKMHYQKYTTTQYRILLFQSRSIPSYEIFQHCNHRDTEHSLW